MHIKLTSKKFPLMVILHDQEVLPVEIVNMPWEDDEVMGISFIIYV